MFRKVILSNAKQSVKDYLIYFFTLTLSIILFYAFVSISSSDFDVINSKQFDLGLLFTYIKYISVAISFLLIILMIYVNKYILKNRSQEFGIYMILGMSSKKVANMFIAELSIITSVAIFLGVIIGAFFSNAIIAIILNNTDEKSIFIYSFYKDSILITIVFWGIVTILLTVYDYFIITHSKLVNLIKSNQKLETKTDKTRVFYILLTGICIFAFAFSLLNLYQFSITQKFNYIDIGTKSTYVIKIIIGMVVGIYSLFSISPFLIKKLQATNFCNQKLNMLLCGGLIKRAGTNAVIWATLTISLMLGIACFIGAPFLATWITGFNNYKNIFDIQITEDYRSITQERDMAEFLSIDYREVDRLLNERGYYVNKSIAVNLFFQNEDDFEKRVTDDFPILVIKESDYNYLLKMIGVSQIHLEETEIGVQIAKTSEIDQQKYLSKYSTTYIGGDRYTLEKENCYYYNIGEAIYNAYTDALLIVPDEGCRNLKVATKNYFVDTSEILSYKDAKEIRGKAEAEFDSQLNNLQKQYIEKSNNKSSVFTEFFQIRIKTEQNNVSMINSLMIQLMGIYLGIIICVITITILALQIMFGINTDRENYFVLTRIGADDKDIKHYIAKQVIISYFFPLMVAVIGSMIFIFIIMRGYSREINAYIGYMEFIKRIAGPILVSVLIYVAYGVLIFKLYMIQLKNRKFY